MKKKQFIHYDSNEDILYIASKKGVEESVLEIAPGINVELNENGEVIGIEIFRASKVLKPVAKPLYKQMHLINA